jgi:hypothetical protein
MLADLSEVRRFYHFVVPYLKDHECLLLLLAARKKYCPTLARSEEVVAREVIRDNDWSKFKRKVKKITNVEGIYVDKNGNEIPKEAFALYILLDPRDAVYAWIKFQEETNKLFWQSYKNDKSALYQLKKLDVRWFSVLHRTPSRKLYWLIDVDGKNENLLDSLLKWLDDHVIWVSETRGGYHIIVHCNHETQRILFRERLTEKFKDVELHKQVLTPLPGTLQGGFAVRGVLQNEMERGIRVA